MLAQIPFLLPRQASSRFFACLAIIFASQASISRLSCLPGFPFRFTGKHFPAFPLAWISLLAFRQSVVP